MKIEGEKIKIGVDRKRDGIQSINFEDNQIVINKDNPIEGNLTQINYKEVNSFDYKNHHLRSDKIVLKTSKNNIHLINPDIEEEELDSYTEKLLGEIMIPDKPSRDNILRILAPSIKESLEEYSSAKYIHFKQNNKQYGIEANIIGRSSADIFIDGIMPKRIESILRDQKPFYKKISKFDAPNNDEGAKIESVNYLEDALEIVSKIIYREQGEVNYSGMTIGLEINSRMHEGKVNIISPSHIEDFKRIWGAKIPKKLEAKKKEIIKNFLILEEDKVDDSKLDLPLEDIEELLTNRDKFIDEIYKEYKEEIEKFMEQYGSGNRQQIEMLMKVLNTNYGEGPSLNNLELVLTQKYREKQKLEMRKLLEEYNPKLPKDYIEAFVKEFGKGNEASQTLLSEITGVSKGKLQRMIEESIVNLREDKNIEKFAEDLGIDDNKKLYGTKYSKTNMATKKDESSSIIDENPQILEDLKNRQHKWSEIKKMGGIEFEHLIKDLFIEKGYETKVTPASNDQGADLIAEKPLEKIVVQAKRHSNKVSNSAIQEVSAAVKHYDADKGIVVTTKGYTSSAKELAESNDIETWAEYRLREEIEKYLNMSKI